MSYLFPRPPVLYSFYYALSGGNADVYQEVGVRTWKGGFNKGAAPCTESSTIVAGKRTELPRVLQAPG